MMKIRKTSPGRSHVAERDPTTSWMEWARTDLATPERERLLAALTPEQAAHLHGNEYVWVPGVGVLWNSVEGPLRRGRYTHSTHFATPRGEFVVDPEGRVHRRSVLRGNALTMRDQG